MLVLLALNIYQQKDLDQILGNMKSLSEAEISTDLGIPDKPILGI
jgi:hypothetical protein